MDDNYFNFIKAMLSLRKNTKEDTNRNSKTDSTILDELNVIIESKARRNDLIEQCNIDKEKLQPTENDKIIHESIDNDTDIELVKKLLELKESFSDGNISSNQDIIKFIENKAILDDYPKDIVIQEQNEEVIVEETTNEITSEIDYGLIDKILELKEQNLLKEEVKVPEPQEEPEIDSQSTSRNNNVKEFVQFSKEYLGLQSPVMVNFTDNRDSGITTAGYDPNDKSSTIYVKGRALVDILRSIAHELVHQKQDEEGELSADSGETGSDHENQANAIAGILMREYQKNHPEIYEDERGVVDEYVEVLNETPKITTTTTTTY
jgi:hypothetical protein